MDLRAVILERARVEGDMLLVDEFLNHRVEPAIVDEIGRRLAGVFAGRADLVITAEASGIPPALACARALDVPMIYAKKYLGPGRRYVYAREVASPTRGMEYRVEVARRVLPPGRRVAVVDDFLAGGRTAEALGQIVAEAGSEVAGFGFVIEKRFAGGRDRLVGHGWPVHSLVEVLSLTGGIVLAD